jgi:hypothetical protein
VLSIVYVRSVLGFGKVTRRRHVNYITYVMKIQNPPPSTCINISYIQNGVKTDQRTIHFRTKIRIKDDDSCKKFQVSVTMYATTGGSPSP